jgi:dipeptidyl aminopeptidase/acylaminoacyl peptidase
MQIKMYLTKPNSTSMIRFKLKSILALLLLITMNNLELNAQKTPIIDRDIFFGNPEISSGQLSPDGKFVSFLKEYEGIMNIWVKAFDEPFEAARPLTDSKRPLYGYSWTVDGAYILYVKDNDGDENMNVWAVNPAEKVENGVPESRNLTPLEEVTAQIYHSSLNNADLLFIGLNDRDKAWHDLYSLKISTGELTKIYENNDRIVSYGFDWDDNLRLLYRTDDKGNTTILYKKGDKLEPIYETSVTEGAGVIAWNEDNSLMYLETNKGDLNLSTLYLMNPETKELTLVESDPEKRVDFGSLRINRNTRKPISTSYVDDKTRIYWKDKEWEDMYKFLTKKFKGREVSFSSSTKAYDKFLITVWGDKYASESYFYNPKTKELIFQYTPRPKLKEIEKHLVAMNPIRYKSSDGLEIPAYLTLPADKKAKNLPVVILVHGGPKGPRDYWGYDPEVQFLANRGFAVLQPNFRASGGYGKDFLNAGDLQWGKLMQDDITWGVKHLINEGIADPSKVVIMGGSYGGYATLAGLAFTPEVFAAGIDIVGPSNIFTLLESVPAYWEAGRAFLYGMVGDPNTPEGEKLIREASPLFSADKINKPLLIIQGANDPRVKKAEADQIVIALRDKGKPVTYLLADDEGHGFSKPVNKMAMYAEVEKFLAEVIGTPYQKDMPKDVENRLNELRVDVSSVTYTPKVASKLLDKLPEIDLVLEQGSTQFNIKIEVQGQNLEMSMTREIKKTAEGFTVKDDTKGPMGASSDLVEYDTNGLPKTRIINQAGQNIEISFADNAMRFSLMGNNMEIPFTGAFLSDGAGMDAIIAQMPLDALNNQIILLPDLTSGKAKEVKITLSDTEKVNNNECQKVVLTNQDNENDVITLWVNQGAKRTEKMVSVIPAMGNAKMTMIRL